MKIGDIITVQVDPGNNGGFDTAAALVTGVYEDGSARVRVFGSTYDLDTVRNYVDDTGASVIEPTPGSSPANADQPSQPVATQAAPPAATIDTTDLEARVDAAVNSALKPLEDLIASLQSQSSTAATSSAGTTAPSTADPVTDPAAS